MPPPAVPNVPIEPVLVMPPVKVEMVMLVVEPSARPPTKIPFSKPDKIVPELVMPPAKVSTVTEPKRPNRLFAVPPTKMPSPGAVMTPALVIPPPRLGTVTAPPPLVLPPIKMPMKVPWIALVLSSEIPPLMTPVLPTKPVMVPLTKAMPEGLIVPSLVMAPVKLVLSTQTLATVFPDGLSKLAVILFTHGAASAAGAPPPIKIAATDDDASNRRSRQRPPIVP